MPLLGSQENFQSKLVCSNLFFSFKKIIFHYFHDFFTRHLPDINATLEAMLQPKVTSLPGHIQAVYVQNIAKLYANILASEEEVSLSYEANILGAL